MKFIREYTSEAMNYWSDEESCSEESCSEESWSEGSCSKEYFNIWSEDHYYYYYETPAEYVCSDRILRMIDNQNFPRAICEFVQEEQQKGNILINMNNCHQFDMKNMIYTDLRTGETREFKIEICIVGPNGCDYQSLSLEQWEIIREVRFMKKYLVDYLQIPDSIKRFYPKPFSTVEIYDLLNQKYPHIMP